MKFVSISFLLILLSASNCFSQESDANIFHLNEIPSEGALLDKGWKFHPGDDPAWAKPEFDDSKWESIDPTMDLYYLPQIKRKNQ